MLTPERHRMILDHLKAFQVATVQELSELTSSSESTIRRDLVQLDQEGKLSRIHGGAESLRAKSEETAFRDKVNRYLSEKAAIGCYAAGLVQTGDCIFLDAGTTTAQMIPHLKPDVIVVTNGLTLVEQCLNHGIKTYMIGGEVKERTRAIIGTSAIRELETYRFDKCFLGMNGVDPINGYTTPDPDEAAIKKSAIQLASATYVLADSSKWGKVSFSFVSPLDKGILITNTSKNMELVERIKTQTKVEVVTA